MKSSMVLYVLFLVLSVTIFFTTQANASTLVTQPSHSCLTANTPTPTGNPITLSANVSGQILINEVLLRPGKASYQCNSNAIHAWIELYNPQNQPVTFTKGSITFSDNTQSQQTNIQLANAIPAHGFYVLFFSMVEKGNVLEDASTINLEIQGQQTESVTLPPLAVDQSYIRIPDGSNHWQITNNPTIGSKNSTVPFVSPTKKQPGTHIGMVTVTQQASKQTSTRTRTSIGGGSAINTTATTRKQPQWQALRFPTQTITKPSSQYPLPPTAPQPTNRAETASDMPKKLAQSLFICTLFLLLHWSHRLFSRP
ncbi:hypothetical protein ccbrp13_68600 [Ktedonobacteria bacterium brp13]|nr:hypothetical protein ccbrp13_68600 [Ktedonobacteria bacterium brp13]